MSWDCVTLQGTGGRRDQVRSTAWLHRLCQCPKFSHIPQPGRLPQPTSPVIVFDSHSLDLISFFNAFSRGIDIWGTLFSATVLFNNLTFPILAAPLSADRYLSP